MKSVLLVSAAMAAASLLASCDANPPVRVYGTVQEAPIMNLGICSFRYVPNLLGALKTSPPVRLAVVVPPEPTAGSTRKAVMERHIQMCLRVKPGDTLLLTQDGNVDWTAW